MVNELDPGADLSPKVLCSCSELQYMCSVPTDRDREEKDQERIQKTGAKQEKDREAKKREGEKVQEQEERGKERTKERTTEITE